MENNPFRIDDVSAKSSASELAWSPIEEADDATAEQQQPVRAARSLQRELPTLENAVRSEPGDDNSSLRDRFSVQSRSSKGKTRVSLGSETASKKNDAPSEELRNEWLPDDPESQVGLSNLGTTSALVASDGSSVLPSATHASSSAASSSSSQTSSAVRRHPPVVVDGEMPEPDDESPIQATQSDPLVLLSRKTKTAMPTLQSSEQAKKPRRQKMSWAKFVACLVIIALLAVFTSVWLLWPSTSPEPVNELSEPNP